MRNTRNIILATLLTGGALVVGTTAFAASTPTPEVISAPMRTVVLPPIPGSGWVAPVTPPAAAPAPSQQTPATATPDGSTDPAATPAPEPTAQPGPQPETPGVTTTVTDCTVTWTEGIAAPSSSPTQMETAGGTGPDQVTETYGSGTLANCQAVAAAHPGATIQTVDEQQTTGASS